MAEHRASLITGGGLRRPRIGGTYHGRHRADERYARRVPTLIEGPRPGRHRAPRLRPAVAGPRTPRRTRSRGIASLATSLLATASAVSAWFVASGALAVAAMIR